MVAQTRGVAVPRAAGPPAGLLKVIGDRRARDHGADRQRRAVDALARSHQVGLHPRPVHVAEPLAEAPEARDHLVGDPEEAVLVAERAQARHVVRMGEGAARAQHGLGDDRGDILGPDGAHDMLRRLERGEPPLPVPVLVLGRRNRDVAVRRVARHVGNVAESRIGRDVVAVAPHHGGAHGHAVEGVGLAQDDAAARVEPRHHDAALHRLGARRQDAEAAGPARVAEDVRDHEFRRPGAVLVRHRVGDVAVALHRLGERTVDRRVPVAQVVGDQLAHEVEQPGAVGEHEVVAVGRVDAREAVLVLRLQPVQVVGAVPAFQLVPVACHGALPQTGRATVPDYPTGRNRHTRLPSNALNRSLKRAIQYIIVIDSASAKTPALRQGPPSIVR